ncbi:Gfo/Idh/MocA family protein [Umezawaea sp. NPDC059074]|uniref:Gfo/Idh/MocA family protein n=1 Tax=Umezawaea sp. NPDC059074 TaxID=3346716 RepID=UPI0036736989
MRVALAGIGFMGRAHSFAWRNVGAVYGLPVEMAAVAGGPEDSEDDIRAFARRWGWQSYTTNWQDLIDGPAEVIDVCVPNDMHADIAVASLGRGKHVLCEKPISNTLQDAVRMNQAAAEAAHLGVYSSLAFVYRRMPAVKLAKELLLDGQFGEVRHFSARFLQDWLVDEGRPASWRLLRKISGSGVIGDLGAHLIDLILYLTEDELTISSTKVRRFTDVRPYKSSNLEIDTEESAVSIGSLARGGLVDLHMSRVAASHKAGMSFDIFCRYGRISYALQRPGELVVISEGDSNIGVVERTILVTERSHPYQDFWWEPGQPVGYENAHIHQVGDFLSAIHQRRSPEPSFADGLRVQRIMNDMLTQDSV